MQPPFRIGARASALSKVQAQHVQTLLAGLLDGEADAVAPITWMTTQGDKFLEGPLSEVGGKGLFTKELDDAILAGTIDCAVHSLKDLPTILPPGLAIAAVLKREDPWDAFLSIKAKTFEKLPKGAKLGTASLRRKAQALFLRPDLKVELLRGNVDTRIKKLEAGEYDAIILAVAGLNRLGLQKKITEVLDPEDFLPAAAQGAVCIVTRAEDAADKLWKKLNHTPSQRAVAAERAALEALDGSCRTAIGANLVEEDGILRLSVEILKDDGSDKDRITSYGPAGDIDNAADLGEVTAKALKARIPWEMA